jgi:D-methionine transport system ATP-binding protein
MIQLCDVIKRYPTSDGIEMTALDGVSLSIEAGEIYGIIGMSGAGKTTLVRCINYLNRPTSGQVVVDGKDLGMLRPAELCQLRREVGMIFQHYNLLMQSTVLKNVSFPLRIAGVPKAEAKQRAMDLLQLVGMADKAEAYPAQLSGGQKQRVAIARTLTTNPKVILCDEATSALDPMTTRAILALLKEINQRMGITIVVITHEMSVIRQICHKVAVMDQCRIVEQGLVEEVFSHPQSKATRHLVFGDRPEVALGRKYQLTFDENAAMKPIFSDMILACQAQVSVLTADLATVEGRLQGTMLVQMPADEYSATVALDYLRLSGVGVEEVVGREL